MTKKHFEALARSLRIARDKMDTTESLIAMNIAIETVANVCARYNGRFDRGRFKRACGLNG